MAAKEENIPLLKWMQEEARSSGTDQYFDIGFSIGPWNKSGFQIRVKGGEMGTSEPDAMLESLMEYDLLTVEIYQFPSGLSEDSLKMDPLEVENIKITFDVRVAPSPVHPQENDKFKDMEWSKHFMKSPAGVFSHISRAKVSPDLVCQIVKDCHAMYNMKAFW